MFVVELSVGRGRSSTEDGGGATVIIPLIFAYQTLFLSSQIAMPDSTVSSQTIKAWLKTIRYRIVVFGSCQTT